MSDYKYAIEIEGVSKSFGGNLRIKASRSEGGTGNLSCSGRGKWSR